MTADWHIDWYWYLIIPRGGGGDHPMSFGENIWKGEEKKGEKVKEKGKKGKEKWKRGRKKKKGEKR
jgi:hypothetical protein